MCWAVVAVIRARRELRRQGLEAVAVASPPALPPHAVRGVGFVLRARPSTCLERALVLQAWHAAHGSPRAIVIGVAGSSRAFRAHAWLEGELPGTADYEELVRLPPR